MQGRAGSLTDELGLRDIARQSAAAVMALWNEQIGSFWRSTQQRRREEQGGASQEFFPTVTFCSIEALVRYCVEFPDWVSGGVEAKVRDEYVPAVVGRDLENVRSTLDAGDGRGLNSFTLAYYVQALISLIKLLRVHRQEDKPTVDKAKVATRHLVQASRQTSRDTHPFLIFHVIRACRSSLSTAEEDSDLEKSVNEAIATLLDVTRATASSLLVRHQVGLLNPSGAIALGFCAATLAQSDNETDHVYVVPALECLFQGQDPSGAWALGRIVHDDKDIEPGRLEISTYEIAWAMTDAVRELSRRRRDSLGSSAAKTIVGRLILASDYARKSRVGVPGSKAPTVGWCSDYPYDKPMVESWTSAMVLQSALSLHELIQEVDRFETLGEFTSFDPQDAGWPGWLRWGIYRTNSEPETDYRILDYIHRNIVEPILSSPRQLPSAEARTTSALLFGPPGTQKTSTVKAVADGLNWPVVILSPGEFIQRGLEFIEAEATEIFNRLMRLSRAVVLFDECDELFRSREPSSESEQTRGIAAFVTAAMLPKLQELHDRGRVVYFICTNQFDSMDNAVTRGGRIDHIIGVGPPDKDLRSRIVRETMDAIMATESPADRGRQIRPAILDELASLTERFTRVELQRAVKALMGEGDEVDAPTVRALVDRMTPSLTITPEEYDSFRRQREFSHPHIETR